MGVARIHRHQSLHVCADCRLSRRPAARSHRLTVVVAAQQQQRSEGVTRREAGLAALAALAAFTSAAQPAQAIFGLGAKEATEKYEKSTVRAWEQD